MCLVVAVSFFRILELYFCFLVLYYFCFIFFSKTFLKFLFLFPTVCDGAFCNDVLFTFDAALQKASDGSYRTNTTTGATASGSPYEMVWKQTQWWDLDAPQTDEADETDYKGFAIPNGRSVKDDQLEITGNIAELVTAVSSATMPKFLQFSAVAPTRPLYDGKLKNKYLSFFFLL